MSPWAAIGLLLALGLAVSVHDLVLRPTFRRIALRSIRRRVGEAVLVVAGAALGTAIIGAALVVGDSFDGSIRDIARTDLGPIDVVARIATAQDTGRRAAQLEDLLGHSGLPSVDGLLTGVSAPAVFDNGRTGDRQQVDPGNCLLEVDVPSARRFGGDAEITGLADVRTTPAGDEVIVTERTARRLELEVGDTLVAHLYGASLERRVRTIVPAIGVAGYCGAIVAQGTIGRVATDSPIAAVQPPMASLFISARGAVFTDPADSTRIVDAAKAAVDGSALDDVEVEPLKQNLLDRAQRQGENLRTIFSGIGGFSVIAGILLLVNLVVMLAEERKVELGVLRAVGLKRNHLLRAFSLEGAIYAVTAAVFGALLAIGVGAGIIWGTQELFGESDDDFRVRLFARFPTLAVAAAIGIGISMLTIWSASVRIARLNVIAAIRDLPDPRRHGRRLVTLGGSAMAVVAGVAASVAGASGDSPVPLLAGGSLAALAAINLAGRVVPASVAQGALSVVSILWALGVFVLFPDQMSSVGIAVFVVMGVVLVASAVSIAVVVMPAWHHLLARGSGSWSLAVRLGLAYPLARRFRTGLLLAMFSLVIFTMVFLSAFSSTIGTSAETAPGEMAAGADLMVESNRANPAPPDAVAAIDGVADVAPLVRGGAEFTISYVDEPTQWAVTGFDERLLAHGTPALAERDQRFADDRDAFEAVLADPGLIIVDDRFLQRGGGPTTNAPHPGDAVTIVNETTGRERDLTVAGVLRSDYVFHGSLWQRTATEELLAPFTVANRAFVRVDPGVDPDVVAARITRTLVSNGAEATTFRTVVQDALSQTQGFMKLLQGYLGFGLLIGVAGLGVVLVRAVRERRREIGMLRAIGFPARVASRAFLIEAGFVAIQGVLIGSALALVTAYQVVVDSSAFGNQTVRFVPPWWALAFISVVPVIAALAAAARPARAAGRIRPAVALRISD